MKKITLLFLLYIFTNLSYSQGTDILSAEQFCSGTSQLTFNNVYGGTNATPVGCLGSMPNAAYFYLQIDQPGDLIFTIAQQNTVGTPIDVDFIAWGPFTDLNDANTNISYTDCATCPNNTTNPAFYPYAPDHITDCSFDFAPTETMHILNAVQGEIYVVLITNFNGAQGTITFQQTGGTGTTTCANLPICGSHFYDTGGPTAVYSNNESNTTTINPYFPGGTVIVDFTSFDVAAGDVLNVYNGPNTTFPLLGSVTTAPSTFTSTTVGNPTGALTFRFTSNASVTGNGWISDITCLPPPTPPTCGFTFYDSGGASGNYANNEFQTTTFFPDIPTDAVTATFTAFNLESCCDELRVYDGPNTASPLIGIFTGATIPGPFTSSHASGALTFLFDSDSSVVYSGWAANLTCAPYTPPLVCGSTFYDSGGAGGNYSNVANQTTTLYPDTAGDMITATFTSFYTENTFDILRIYDGPNNTFPLLATLMGNLNATLPGPYTSTHPTGSLTFVFTSDGSVVYSGWAANITCSTTTCSLTIAEVLNPLGATDCNLNYNQLTANYSGGTNSTTTIFSENFNGAAMPAGWNAVNGAASAVWIISNTSNAGGTPREAMLDWTTGSHTNTWTLTSPLINITGSTNLHLGFKQDLYLFGSDFSIYVETSLNGTVWTPRYSAINPTNDITSTENIDISVLDGNNSLYVRFRFFGDSFDIFYWAIDNVTITADGAPTSPITWTPINGLYTDATLLTPYTTGLQTDIVYAAPNGTQIYTATHQNTCTETATVTRYKKEWKGLSSNDWYNDNNWFPIGIPDANNCVVIPNVTTDPIIIGGPPTPPPAALAKNLTVENFGYLEIQSFGSIVVTDEVIVQPNGTFDIRDDASLVQITDVTTNSNIGSINMRRTVNGVGAQDYVYWSSAVDAFNVENISRDTPSTSIWKWLPTQTTGGGTGHHGDWINPTANEQMINGKGYIVSGLSNTSTTLPLYTSEFNGKPHNGIIQVPITRGTHLAANGDYTGDNGVVNGTTHQDDNWNLIGNPYPSAISYSDFINYSSVSPTRNNLAIDGTIYIWTHQSAPSPANASPFYQDFVSNYNPNDYITNNFTGPNPPAAFNGYIAAGQAFFVLMLDNASPNENVYFSNTMRDATYANNQFYRSSQNSNTIERHRIWLDLVNSNHMSKSILIGYCEGATDGDDRLYEGYEFGGTPLNFYSLIENAKFSIQGKAIPFEDTDMVPLGVVIPENDIYTIAINTIDGLFLETNQTIYLEDTYTNTIHDLRTQPYSFASESGTFNDRFILRYTNQALGVGELENNELTIIAPNSDYIKVKSTQSPIQAVTVYDILSRVLFDKKNVNLFEFILNEKSLSDGTYLVKATLVNGKHKIQKVILK